MVLNGDQSIELLGKNKRFRRIFKAIATGGLSEVARNKVGRAFLTAGLSTKFGRGLATGGMSLIAERKRRNAAVNTPEQYDQSQQYYNQNQSYYDQGGQASSYDQPQQYYDQPQSQPIEYVDQPVTQTVEQPQEIVEYVDAVPNDQVQVVEQGLSGDKNNLMIYAGLAAVAYYLFVRKH